MSSQYIARPESLELVELEEPHAEDGQVVVEVATCGICGSDLHSYSHGVAAKPGQILGHEFSGRVVEAPGVEGISVGDRVTVRPLLPCGECDRCREGDVHLCEAGHAMNIGYGFAARSPSACSSPARSPGQTVFRLPDSIGDRGRRAGRAARRRTARVGRRTRERTTVMLVLGAGMIGLAAAALPSSAARTLIVADPSPVRRGAAEGARRRRHHRPDQPRSPRRHPRDHRPRRLRPRRPRRRRHRLRRLAAARSPRASSPSATAARSR